MAVNPYPGDPTDVRKVGGGFNDPYGIFPSVPTYDAQGNLTGYRPSSVGSPGGFSLFGSQGSQAVNAAIGSGVPVGTTGSSLAWWQNPANYGKIISAIGAGGNLLSGGDDGVSTGRFNFSPLSGGNLPAGPDINAILELYSQMGGGGGGGGGNRQSFINQLLQDPRSFGNIDPSIMSRLDTSSGLSQGEYQQFLSTINSGAGGLFNFLAGGNNPILNSILGEGGGGINFGAGGGGFPTSAAGIFQGLPNLDLERILAEIPQLSPDVQAEFDAILASNTADIESQRGEQNSNLIARLYGRGVNQSTLALEDVNRLNESLERTLLATRSEDASRRLGARMELGGRQLTADLARQQGLIDIFGQRLGSATSQAVAGIGASAQERSASISAASSLAGARLNALTDLYRTQVGGLTDIFGTQAGALASGLGSRQGFLGETFGDLSSLGLGLAGLENERFLNLANLSQSGINANRSAGNARFNQIMDLMRFQEAVNQRTQSGQLTREGFQVDRDIGRLNAPREPSDWDRLIALGSVVGSFFGG